MGRESSYWRPASMVDARVWVRGRTVNCGETVYRHVLGTGRHMEEENSSSERRESNESASLEENDTIRRKWYGIFARQRDGSTSDEKAKYILYKWQQRRQARMKTLELETVVRPSTSSNTKSSKANIICMSSLITSSPARR